MGHGNVNLINFARVPTGFDAAFLIHSAGHFMNWRFCLTPFFVPQMYSSRSVYRGSGRKLILAFDVGTTYSGISYR